MLASYDNNNHNNNNEKKHIIIGKTQDDPLCSMCRQKEESISHGHLLSECPKRANTKHKQRHDGVPRALHWDICDQNGLHCGEKWYDHVPERSKH